MKNDEVSVTFHAEKKLIDEFDKAKDIKATVIGIRDLTRKQAFQLAIKEAIERWKTEKPGI